MQKCRFCGAELPLQARFCGSCGKVQNETTSLAADIPFSAPASPADMSKGLWPELERTPLSPMALTPRANFSSPGMITPLFTQQRHEERSHEAFSEASDTQETSESEMLAQDEIPGTPILAHQIRLVEAPIVQAPVVYHPAQQIAGEAAAYSLLQDATPLQVAVHPALQISLKQTNGSGNINQAGQVGKSKTEVWHIKKWTRMLLIVTLIAAGASSALVYFKNLTQPILQPTFSLTSPYSV